MTVLMVLWTLLLGCEAPPEQGGGPPAALVEVAEATAGPLTDRWTTLGDVRSTGRAELAAAADGTLTEVRVREGDRVASRDVLALVDPDLARAQLAAAKAALAGGQVDLDLARSELSRIERLPAGVLSESEQDTARSQVASLEAQVQGLQAAVDQALARLERHRVRAPFDGVVAARHVDAGDYVGPGTPVLDVVSDGELEIHVDVPPELLPLLGPDQPATLSVRGEPVQARVLAVVPALSPSSRTARVRLSPEGQATWLLPGAAVEVAIEVVRDGGVVVPRDALVLGPADPTVVKVSEGAAESLVVQVLATAGERALVHADGLAIGDQVVTRGNERLRPGQALTIGSLE